MRRFLSCLGLALLSAVTARGGGDTNFLAGFSWPVGEKLTYQLYWGLIPVGSAVVWTEWAELDGQRLLAIRLRTVSNKVIEKIYPVNDTIESLIEPASFLPVRFTKNMSEGSSRHHEVTRFDRTNLVARWESKITGKTNAFTIEPDTRDIPSLMYFLRNQRFEPGKRDHFRVMADEKIYDLWVNVNSKEPVSLPGFDRVGCTKVEPEAAFNGLFVRKGKMWVWISEDSRTLATKIEASIPVANVRAILLKVEGPGQDFWTTPKPAK